jgi:adenosine deaminase/adenosine deaminase CECR1
MGRDGMVAASLLVFTVYVLAPAPVAAGSRTLEGHDSAGAERAAVWLDAHRGQRPLLRMFLQRMPKGGDIHTHLSGAVYAESYLEWAADAGLCVKTATGTITPPGTGASPSCDAQQGLVSVGQMLGEPRQYRTLVDRLSTRNLANRRQSGHNQFFDSFARFSAATGGRWSDMVAEVAARAADQHVSYLEIMLGLRGGEIQALASQTGFDGDFARTHARLRRERPSLDDLVQAAVSDLDDLEHGVAGKLGCGGNRPPAACHLVRRYLVHSVRTLDPAAVFAQLALAFEVAHIDPRVVGINLVAPEDDRVAVRDYRLHMEMVGWLGARYPEVGIALHAGELTLGLVPPDALRFHIREAVEVAGARRIGHGVAIGYERDAWSLLSVMRERAVLVEICLTSNDVILGVSGSAHPLPAYLSAGVPVALATDDEGVSRIDLTHEYVRAVENHGLGYKDLKQMARRSLAYSFLEGASLWRDPAMLEMTAACAGAPPPADPAPDCRAFLEANVKARLQWDLEGAFSAFESLPWNQ